MASTKYTYSILADFPNSKLDSTSLTSEIRGSEIVVALDYIATVGDSCGIWFKDTLSAEDAATLNGLIAEHSGIPDIVEEVSKVTLENLSTTESGKLQVSQYKCEGSSKTFVTHDWCDKTTWFQESTQAIDETLNLDSELIYGSANTHWINLVSGNMYDEDNILAEKDYRAYVKVDDALVTSGFTIDYVNGKVTFDEAPSGIVKASYYYAGSSTYSIIPSSGKQLGLEHSELQFSKNTAINTPIHFEIWVFNPYDYPNKVKYKSNQYKSGKDFINSCNLGQGVIPVFDNLTEETIVFPFNYTTIKLLKSSLGAELRMHTGDDKELEGNFGTCTFYTYSEDEI